MEIWRKIQKEMLETKIIVTDKKAGLVGEPVDCM